MEGGNGRSQSSEIMFKLKRIILQNFIWTCTLKSGQRSLCAQLRTGTLAVQVGRCSPEEQCFCVFRDLGVVEDEFHFVFLCPLYKNLSSVLFERMQGEEHRFVLVNWRSDIELFFFFNENIFVLAGYLKKAENSICGALGIIMSFWKVELCVTFLCWGLTEAGHCFMLSHHQIITHLEW